MPSYRRSAASLDELREQVLLAFGPEARIVEATRVTRRGVGRWLARDEIEATVKVPEGAAPAGGVDASRLDRSGIAALLADADDGDLAGGGAGVGAAAGTALHLGDLTARRADPPDARARHNATLNPSAAPPDVAEWRAHEADDEGEIEQPLPSTAAPAFAALLAAVERSLGVEEPPAGATAPLRALPELPALPPLADAGTRTGVGAGPRTRHNATLNAPTTPSDVANGRAHEPDDAEPALPPTAAPAFAALLAAVERSLEDEEPPAVVQAPLLALPELPVPPPRGGAAPLRQNEPAAPPSAVEGGADGQEWRTDAEGGGGAAAAALSAPNGDTPPPAEDATAPLRQHEPLAPPPAAVRGADGQEWRTGAEGAGGAAAAALSAAALPAPIGDTSPPAEDATAPLRQYDPAAPPPAAVGGAVDGRWRNGAEGGGGAAAAALPAAALFAPNGDTSPPAEDATAPLRQHEPLAPPPEAVGGAVDGRWRDRVGAAAPEAGDLVLLVGLGDDAARVAREISGERGWPVSWVRVTAARSGARAGTRAVARTSVIADRRAALSARADALRLEREVLLAHAATIDDPFTAITALRPDRVWAVVDASRSPADTAEWVGRLDEALGVDAVAIVGTAFTRDRRTAARLGLPVAWEEPPEASA